MPDISASLSLLDATVFVYPTVQDAEEGKKFGGSGVIVGVPLRNRPDLCLRYVVTNWHVAVQKGHSVIRLNLPGGGVHTVDKDPSEWTFIPGRADLAAILLPKLPDGVNPTVVPTTRFIVDAPETDVHVGDDVFMVGRFIDYDGHETNRPATRFGAISMMDAPIKQPSRYRGRSIVVDMHSRTGFSGSPVYVYRPGNVMHLPGVLTSTAGLTRLEGPVSTYRRWGIGNNADVRLLGLLWGQFPEAWELSTELPTPASEASLITEGAYVRGFSGMSCVVPAAEIIDLLNHADFKGQREELDKLYPQIPPAI